MSTKYMGLLLCHFQLLNVLCALSGIRSVNYREVTYSLTLRDLVIIELCLLETRGWLTSTRNYSSNVKTRSSWGDEYQERKDRSVVERKVNYLHGIAWTRCEGFIRGFCFLLRARGKFIYAYSIVQSICVFCCIYEMCG